MNKLIKLMNTKKKKYNPKKYYTMITKILKKFPKLNLKIKKLKIKNHLK